MSQIVYIKGKFEPYVITDADQPTNMLEVQPISKHVEPVWISANEIDYYGRSI